MLKTHGTLTLKIYVFDILFQLVGIGFVCVGLYLAATPFGKLIGNHWAGINDAIRDIWLGVLFWLVAIGLSVIMYFVLGPSYDRPSRVLPRTSLELLLFSVLATTAGICEEIMFRGYLFKQFTKLTGHMEVGLFLQAVVFAAAHGYHQTLSGVANNFTFAIVFGILATWRQSLLPGIIAHVWLDVSVGLSTLFFP